MRINGTVAGIGTKVRPGDRVTVDSRAVFPEQTRVYMAVNKPAGVLSATRSTRLFFFYETLQPLSADSFPI